MSRLSLGIVIKAPEGLVLAAESRITLTATNPQTGQSTSVNYDNAQKVLQWSAPHTYVGAVTYGVGGIGVRSAPSFISEFESSLPLTRLSVEEFAVTLSDFYLKQWDAAMPSDYKGPSIVFLVAGYNDDEPYGRVYLIEIPRAPQPVQQKDLNDFGWTWGGQREIMDRLLSGYDGRAIESLRNALGLTDDQVTSARQALREFQMNVPIQFLPLQDCIDLAIFFIRTTMEGQRFSIGIRGVGGPIDVATITRSSGFQWVQRKQIRGEAPKLF